MMKIHFLNVGHGDCTIVEFPSGRLMMIDINNSKSLPEADEEALAESKGVSLYDFRYRRSQGHSPRHGPTVAAVAADRR